MVNYRFFTALFGLIVALTLVLLIRRSRLHSSLFIWWSSMIALMLVFAFYPNLINMLGKYFKISYPPVIISVVGLGLVFVKILSMDIYITRNEARYNRLAQKLALLEMEMREHQEDKIRKENIDQAERQRMS